MAVVYRYARKETDDVVYVGITGTKGRIDGIDAVEIRDREHFTNKGDPLYESEIEPNELNLDYIDGLSECDALALETMAIGYYNPKYNTSKNNMGSSDFYCALRESGELFWTRMGERRRASRAAKMETKRANGKTKGDILSAEQIDLLESCVQSDKFSDTTERDWCIIALLLYSPMRLSDIVDMEVNDFSESCVLVRRTNEKVKVCEKLNHALKNWLNIRIEMQSKSGNAMFLSGQHKRISPKTIQWFVSKYGLSAGIKNCTAASLIRTYRQSVQYAILARL